MPLSSGHKSLIVEDVAGDSKVNRQYRNAVTENSEAVALETRWPH
jgi:hypothetical protein